jgi:hypothetical protein
MIKISAVVWHGSIAFLIMPALLSAQDLQRQATSKPTDIGAVEVLADREGTDVRPYLEQVIKKVREKLVPVNS